MSHLLLGLSGFFLTDLYKMTLYILYPNTFLITNVTNAFAQSVVSFFTFLWKMVVLRKIIFENIISFVKF